jgi:hypothetical protein
VLLKPLWTKDIFITRGQHPNIYPNNMRRLRVDCGGQNAANRANGQHEPKSPAACYLLAFSWPATQEHGDEVVKQNAKYADSRRNRNHHGTYIRV